MTGVTGGYTVASCHSADAHSAAMCTIRPPSPVVHSSARCLRSVSVSSGTSCAHESCGCRILEPWVVLAQEFNPIGRPVTAPPTAAAPTPIPSPAVQCTR